MSNAWALYRDMVLSDISNKLKDSSDRLTKRLSRESPSDADDIMFWMGKRVDEMSREELIDALVIAARSLATYQTPERSRAYSLGMVEIMKRG